MNTIANYIKNVPELAEEYAELAAEIQKDIEKAEANRAACFAFVFTYWNRQKP